MQGFFLQGSFVDTGLKGFFLQSAGLFLAMERFFLAIWCGLLLARRGGSAVRGGEGKWGDERGGTSCPWDNPTAKTLRFKGKLPKLTKNARKLGGKKRQYDKKAAILCICRGCVW